MEQVGDGPATGESMAKSAGYSTRTRSLRTRGLADAVAALKRRLLETSGFALLLVVFLLVSMLLTYDSRDPSLNTATSATPYNFLGHYGAILADLLSQSLGLADLLIPILLLAWSLRLLLHRPLRSIWLRLAFLPLILVLGAFALSVLDLGALSPPAGSGGVIGGEWQRLLSRSGLGTMSLPISMSAAALVGLLLLVTMGLSWRDWYEIGGGAGRGVNRIAAFSGREAIAAARFGGWVFRRWRGARLV